MGLLVDTFARVEGERKRAEMCPRHWHAATCVNNWLHRQREKQPCSIVFSVSMVQIPLATTDL